MPCHTWRISHTFSIVTFQSAIMRKSYRSTLFLFTSPSDLLQRSVSYFCLGLTLLTYLFCLHQVQPFYKHLLNSCVCLKHLFFSKTKFLCSFFLLMYFHRCSHFWERIMGKKREDNSVETSQYFMVYGSYQNTRK